MNSPKVGIASIAVVAAAVLTCATGASAITVTSTGDTGACTLRGAINAAASNNSSTACGPVVSGGTTPINLPANTYTPFDGELVVPAGANIAINGDNVNNPLSTKIDALGASVAELSAEQKNRVSHRALAAAQMRGWMREAWQLG